MSLRIFFGVSLLMATCFRTFSSNNSANKFSLKDSVEASAVPNNALNSSPNNSQGNAQTGMAPAQASSQINPQANTQPSVVQPTAQPVVQPIAQLVPAGQVEPVNPGAQAGPQLAPGQNPQFHASEHVEPVEPSEPAGLENPMDIQESMDTIESDDEGNWLLKRVWWEHAEDLFGKIISLNDKIMQSQIKLINQRNDLDKRVADAFKALDIDQVKLSETLEYIYSDVATISESPELVEEKALSEKFTKYKESLDKINKALNDIQEQENLLSESMIQLMKLVNECRGYENSSWKNFKEIGRILNDEKAKELFYQVDAAHKNVQQYLNYINGELSSFINKAMGNISNLVDQISQELSSLKSQDASVDSFITEHKNIIEKKKQLKEQEAKKNATVKKKKVSQGFFAKVSAWFGSIFSSIKKFFGFGK